jgi:biotin carboxyl carrier protein
VLFHVEVNGRIREVAVERHGGDFKVTVDGQAQHLRVSPVDPTTLSVIVLDETAASHEIGFSVAASSESVVHVDGVPVQASLAAGRRRQGEGGGGTGAGGVQVIKAPMPGRVARVLVAAGDRVQPRQGVVVVEAMKMENELRAAKAGVVSQVRVEAGASVEAGAVLVVIE